MRSIAIAILAWMSFWPAAASADACRTVHGRMFMANGAPSVRIGIVGSRRILGVVQPHESFQDLPSNVRQLWSAGGDEDMWKSDLFGDFRVCGLAPDRAGRMQLVRIEQAARLRVRPRP